MKICNVCGESKSLVKSYRGLVKCFPCIRAYRSPNKKASNRNYYYNVRRPKELKGPYHPHFADGEEWNREEGRKRIQKAYKERNPWRYPYYSADRRWKIKSHPGGGFTVEQWKEVWDQHDGQCVYCGSTDTVGMDHKMPYNRGGKHEIDNVVPCCRSCNARKQDRTPEEFLLLIEAQKCAV